MAKQVNLNGKKSRCNRNRRNDVFAGKPIPKSDKGLFKQKVKRKDVEKSPVLKAIAKKPNKK